MGDIAFDARRLQPRAFWQATESMAQPQVWPSEILRGLLECESGLEENESTILNHDANVPRCVPSARKTSVLEWVDSLLMSPDGPRERNCLVAEATKKGIGLMLLNDKRALHTSAVPSSGQSSFLVVKLEE